MLNKMKNLVIAEEGQGMTEYGLVLGVIAIAAVGLLLALKDQIVTLYESATGNIGQAVGEVTGTGTTTP
jgi:pilus assembly protein Flp/PilA